MAKKKATKKKTTKKAAKAGTAKEKKAPKKKAATPATGTRLGRPPRDVAQEPRPKDAVRKTSPSGKVKVRLVVAISTYASEVDYIEAPSLAQAFERKKEGVEPKTVGGNGWAGWVKGGEVLRRGGRVVG